MKLPYSTILTDLAGQPIQTQAEVKAVPATSTSPAVEAVPAKFLTFKDALLAAYSANHADDEKLSNTDRYAMGKLGFAIGKDKDLDVEDVAKVKERVGKVLTPGLVFQVYDLIEAAAAPVEVAE